MYCSACGNQIKKGLNYCNSCGARVVDSDAPGDGKKFESLSTAIGFVGIGGIVGFIILIKTLLDYNVDPPTIILLPLLFLATIFGICWLLISQLMVKPNRSAGAAEFTDEVPRAVKAADTNQLEEPKEAPASVVENTTRTLDEVPIERK